MIGDFNDVLLNSENEGGNMRTATSMRSFWNFVTNSRLLDLGFEGYPYIWRNRHDEGFIQERINRALATNEWLNCYLNAGVKHVALEGSDHVMLILSMEVVQPRRKR